MRASFRITALRAVCATNSYAALKCRGSGFLFPSRVTPSEPVDQLEITDLGYRRYVALQASQRLFLRGGR